MTTEWLTDEITLAIVLLAYITTQGRPKAYPATQNASQKSLGDRNKEVGGGATQFLLGIPQFHFHFSRVDFLRCEYDTSLQNSTADPQNKTSSFQNV